MSIRLADPDDNQYELWAPSGGPPTGAMDSPSPEGVGRISHVVLESTDLRQTEDFYQRFLGATLEREASRPDPGTRLERRPEPPLVIRLGGGGRLIFYPVGQLNPRIGAPQQFRGRHIGVQVPAGALSDMAAQIRDAWGRLIVHPMVARGELPPDPERDLFLDPNGISYHLVALADN